MMDWIEALILGVVQGLAEFLPISSKGHLALTQIAFDRAQGRTESGKENLFFAVMLHIGTVGAILFHSRAILASAARGFFTSAETRRSVLWPAAKFAIIATVPAVVVGLLLKKRVEAAFESIVATAIGFLFTAALLVWTQWRTSKRGPDRDGAGAEPLGKTLGEMTVWDALIVGCAQAVALMPGVSRSGMTVAAGLLAGLSRGWSVGFSLLISVPIILGAATKEVLDEGLMIADAEDAVRTLAAMIVAGIVGYLAILWLVRLVRGGKLWYCSVYLVIVATAVLIANASLGLSRDTGERIHERESAALDRAARLRDPRSTLGEQALGPLVPLAGPDSSSARTGDPALGSSSPRLR